MKVLEVVLHLQPIRLRRHFSVHFTADRVNRRLGRVRSGERLVVELQLVLRASCDQQLGAFNAFRFESLVQWSSLPSIDSIHLRLGADKEINSNKLPCHRSEVKGAAIIVILDVAFHAVLDEELEDHDVPISSAPHEETLS